MARSGEGCCSVLQTFDSLWTVCVRHAGQNFFSVSFSVMVSGISGQHGEARKRIDALVLEISDQLWKRDLAALASR